MKKNRIKKRHILLGILLFVFLAFFVVPFVNSCGEKLIFKYRIFGKVYQGGTVQLSASGLSGVTITLGGASSQTTTTNSSGEYAFTGLTAGTYTITPSKSGLRFLSTSESVVLSADRQDVNFTSSTEVFSASGSVAFGDSSNGISLRGVSGVTVTVGSSIVTTDADGSWEVLGLLPDTYSVSVSKEGWTLTGDSSITISASLPATSHNYSAIPAGWSIVGWTPGTGRSRNKLNSVLVSTQGIIVGDNGTVLIMNGSANNWIDRSSELNILNNLVFGTILSGSNGYIAMVMDADGNLFCSEPVNSAGDIGNSWPNNTNSVPGLSPQIILQYRGGTIKQLPAGSFWKMGIGGVGSGEFYAISDAGDFYWNSALYAGSDWIKKQPPAITGIPSPHINDLAVAYDGGNSLYYLDVCGNNGYAAQSNGTSTSEPSFTGYSPDYDTNSVWTTSDNLSAIALSTTSISYFSQNGFFARVFQSGTRTVDFRDFPYRIYGMYSNNRQANFSGGVIGEAGLILIKE